MAPALRSKDFSGLVHFPRACSRRPARPSSRRHLRLRGDRHCVCRRRSPDPGATGATGSVGALGADPTVRVAARKHCVSSKVKITPQYTGGGGLVVSHLYLNSERVATRYSIGTLSISIKRFERGLNGIELISEFSDGRVASISRNIRRCGGR